jgi:aldoxime dehydratase
MTATIIDVAPPEAFGPSKRTFPLRKANGFVPQVQRWSFLLPADCEQMRVGFFAVQGRDADAISGSAFLPWAVRALSGHADGPTTLDHARYTDAQGLLNHVVAAYWVDDARFERWMADEALQAWWTSAQRLSDPTGVWREVLRVPRDRQESIFWRDYPAGLMMSDDVSVFPTPFCGYYGAMRDRLPSAATDPLDSPPDAKLAKQPGRVGFGERWRITPPHNFAVIRSANTWGRMDDEQRADYEAKLKEPLTKGMAYLQESPLPTGCASLRMQRKCDAAGQSQPEDHALGHFLSLRHMESWAEKHPTHAAIFSAAISRYKQYGASNQLRTWHEVYVLPAGDQLFEYINCDPGTGLLRWFSGERLA